MIDERDEHQVIRNAVQELCKRFPDEYFRDVDARRAYPERFVDALIDAGWLAAMIPQEYDGSGLGLSAASVILEEINRSGGNSAAVHGQMYNIGTLLCRFSFTMALFAFHGSTFFPAFGKLWINLAFGEPIQGGSAPAMDENGFAGCGFAFWANLDGGGTLMSEFKTPLGRRELDALTLGTEEALLAYKEQRLELQAARKTRDERKLAGSTKAKSSTDDEIV